VNALFTSSDTASIATNSRSRCRTSSNVQIGQIGRLVAILSLQLHEIGV
jgi:hypothetical protein